MFKSKIFKCFIVFTIVICIFSSNIFAANFTYIKDSNSTNQSSIATVAAPQFSFQSVAQVLMEPTTGKIIYANNENEKLLPASVTKVMTLLLIMESIDSGKIKYTDKVTCSARASSMGGSQIWFKEGEQLTINDALKAICVVSANDVTVAMAELIGGTEENFVSLMNAKAKELGMENTHFMNSHGIDEENHYTTAKDIALMSRELINKHPDILKYTSIWMDTLRDGAFNISNTNNLIRYYEGATGLKTGSTSKALFNLTATATRNGTTFLSVVIKAPTSAIRQEETKQLLNYGFANYETKNITTKGTIIETKAINKNITQEAEIVVKDDVSVLIEKSEKIETIQNITYNKELTAPILANEVAGKVEFINKTNGEKVGESELIISKDIFKSDFKDYLNKFISVFLIRG
jgi:D-alanyl-D-alanine carboxypeptidase (penicillin-binding protein 5/6)